MFDSEIFFQYGEQYIKNKTDTAIFIEIVKQHLKIARVELPKGKLVKLLFPRQELFFGLRIYSRK